MNRVIFLIDGFNIYHSTLDLMRHTGYCTKWLDLASLRKSYIHLFGKDAQVQAIHYFSAIPYYLGAQNPGKIQRHKNYISCLESSGINVELGRFKVKYVYCDKCKNLFPAKKIVFCFPYARKNKELASLAPGSFSISKKQYIKHQFPNPAVLKAGKEIYKPKSW